eukprot:g2383.t1
MESFSCLTGIPCDAFDLCIAGDAEAMLNRDWHGEDFGLCDELELDVCMRYLDVQERFAARLSSAFEVHAATGPFIVSVFEGQRAMPLAAEVCAIRSLPPEYKDLLAVEIERELSEMAEQRKQLKKEQRRDSLWARAGRFVKGISPTNRRRSTNSLTDAARERADSSASSRTAQTPPVFSETELCDHSDDGIDSDSETKTAADLDANTAHVVEQFVQKSTAKLGDVFEHSSAHSGAAQPPLTPQPLQTAQQMDQNVLEMWEHTSAIWVQYRFELVGAELQFYDCEDGSQCGVLQLSQLHHFHLGEDGHGDTVLLSLQLDSCGIASRVADGSAASVRLRARSPADALRWCEVLAPFTSASSGGGTQPLRGRRASAPVSVLKPTLEHESDNDSVDAELCLSIASTPQSDGKITPQLALNSPTGSRDGETPSPQTMEAGVAQRAQLATAPCSPASAPAPAPAPAPEPVLVPASALSCASVSARVIADGDVSMSASACVRTSGRASDDVGVDPGGSDPGGSGVHYADTPGGGEDGMDSPLQCSASDSPGASLALREAAVDFSESADDTNRNRAIGSANGAGGGGIVQTEAEIAAAEASKPEV